MPLELNHNPAVPNSGDTSIWNPPPVVDDDDDHVLPPESSLTTTAQSNKTTTTTTAPVNRTNGTPQPTALPTSLQICAICNATLSLYNCPRCSTRTCSLTCCRIHKTRGEGCTGRRDRVSFLPLRKFTDSTVLSDYHFLEDVLTVQESGKRVAGNLTVGGGRRPPDAKRRRGKEGNDSIGREGTAVVPMSPLLQTSNTINSNSNSQPKSNTAFILKACGVQPHPPPQSNQPNDPSPPPSTTDPQDDGWLQTQPPAKQRLVHQARERDVRLLLMPAMMQRHLTNKTTRYDATKDCIFWKVDFCFHSFAAAHKTPGTDAVHHTKTILSVNQIQDTDTIASHLSLLLKRHLSHSADATTRSLLKPFCTTTNPPPPPKRMTTPDTIPPTPKTTSHDVQTNKTKKKAHVTNTNNHHPSHHLTANVSLLLKRLPCRSARPSYQTVDGLLTPHSTAGGVGGGWETSATTLGGILRGSTVIEYPTIEVVLRKDKKYFPSLVDEVVSSASESESSDCSSTDCD